MKTYVILVVALAAFLAGCNRDQPKSGPVEGTVVNSKMSIDEQIQKVQADKNIPDGYKESYINSLKQKKAQGEK